MIEQPAAEVGVGSPDGDGPVNEGITGSAHRWIMPHHAPGMVFSNGPQEGSRQSPFSVGSHGGWRTTLALRDGLTRPQSCAVGAESVKDGTGWDPRRPGLRRPPVRARGSTGGPNPPQRV